VASQAPTFVEVLMKTYPLRYTDEPLREPEEIEMHLIEPPEETWYDPESGNLVLYQYGQYYTFIDPASVSIAHGFKNTRLDKEPGMRYRIRSVLEKVRANRAERAVM
jgi:hypothetical protein